MSRESGMASISMKPFKVESVITVDNMFMNMTLADEDEYYGSLDDYISQEINSFEAKGHWYPEEEDVFSGRTDLVWEGWDAAFIKSKGGNNWPVATLLDVVVGAHFKKVLGKRKLDEFSIVEEEEPEESAEIPQDIPPKKEFAVALLACQVLGPFMDWSELESLLGPVCDVIRSRLFDYSVKFVLSIFDEEDYYRICHQFKIQHEHGKFCIKHAQIYDETSTFANLSHTKFSYLREDDVCEACCQLHAYRTMQSEGGIKSLFMKFKKKYVISTAYAKYYLKDSDVPRALELMQKHRPLKGYLRAQLMLELSQTKCFHITDVLTLETIKGLNLPEFYEKCKLDDSGAANKCRELLLSLADNVVVALHRVSLLKADELCNAETNLVDAAQCLFGTFKTEVYEVIKRANHERRMGGKRFIGLAHIWSALSFSRVRDYLPEIVSHHLCPELCLLDGSSSEINTLRLYELSQELASHLGDKEVGLEHLVFSIVYGSSKETLMESCYDGQRILLFKRLRECEANSMVESWRNIDVFTNLLGKRCRFGLFNLFKGRELVDKVHEVATTGSLLLPEYEDLLVV